MQLRKSPQEQQFQLFERQQNKIPRKVENKPTPMVRETTEFEYSSKYHIHNFCKAGQPLFVELATGSRCTSMEVDTGATLFIKSRPIYNTAWTGKKSPTYLTIEHQSMYLMWEGIPVDGAIEIDITYLNQKEYMSLLVITGDGPNLMARDWFCHIKLDKTVLHQQT